MYIQLVRRSAPVAAARCVDCAPSFAEHMEIVTEPREQDPQVVTWKGACILACMESAAELWIRPAEWRALGARVLREKAAFYW